MRSYWKRQIVCPGRWGRSGKHGSEVFVDFSGSREWSAAGLGEITLKVQVAVLIVRRGRAVVDVHTGGA